MNGPASGWIERHEGVKNSAQHTGDAVLRDAGRTAVDRHPFRWNGAAPLVEIPLLIYIASKQYGRGRERESRYASDARAMARRAIACCGDPRLLRRTEPGRASRRGRRRPAACAARRGRDFSGGGHLGHAFRRHARGPAAVPGRLSGPADAVVVPDLRDRGRGCRLHCQRGTIDAGAPHGLRRSDGRRHFHHALHRHGGAACERAHAARAGLCRVEHGRRHRRVRLGALVGRRPEPPAAAHPVGDRLRRGHLRHALHRHGRADAVPARQSVVERSRIVRSICSRSSSQSSLSSFQGPFSCCLFRTARRRLRSGGGDAAAPTQSMPEPVADMPKPAHPQLAAPMLRRSTTISGKEPTLRSAEPAPRLGAWPVGFRSNATA